MHVRELIELLLDDTIELWTPIKPVEGMFKITYTDHLKMELEVVTGPGQLTISEWLIPLCDGAIVGSTEIIINDNGRLEETKFTANKKALIIS